MVVASSVKDPGARAQLVAGEVARGPGGKGSAVMRTPTYYSGSALGVGWLRRGRRRDGLVVLLLLVYAVSQSQGGGLCGGWSGL